MHTPIHTGTERKQRKTYPALLFSSEFMRAFLERIGESGIIVVDSDGFIVYASQRASQVVGETSAHLMEKNYFSDLKFYNEHDQLIAYDQRPAWNALHIKDFTQITPYFCWYEGSSADKKPLAIKATAVDDGHGRFAIVEVREAKRTLKVDEMKTLFISFAAHQLKTPSSIVKGFIELLLREGRKAFSLNQWNNLESAYEANESLIKLSKNLLNITKLEGGMIEPSISSFNVQEIINSKLTGHKLLVTIKNLEIVTQLDPSEVFESDPMFFSEVFDVLFGNAIKYSPEKGIVNIDVRKEGTSLTVVISDQGEGVPVEQEEQLFKPFNASQTHTNSHGMGLMMAKKYIELLGGSIGYERRAEGGSSFYFSLPTQIK